MTRYTTHELAGGVPLHVLTVPSPLVSLQVGFEVGARDESPEEAGAAHFVEHMVFKGTRRRGVGESAAAIEAEGGDLNAWTSVDGTTFHATVPRDAWRIALDVLLDMAFFPRFDPEEVDKERQVILEEIRTYGEDPDSVAQEALADLLAAGHPYGRPVLGFPATVGQLSAADLRRFHRRHYGRGRVTVVVAGDLDPDEVQAAIEPHLAEVPAAETRAALLGPAPTTRQTVLTLGERFESQLVLLGWPAPPIDHPDWPALEVLCAALGQGAASRLQVELQLNRGLVLEASAGALGARLAGQVEILLAPHPDRAAEALAEALDLVARTCRGGLTGRQVQRARDALLTDLLFAEESLDALAQEALQNASVWGRPDQRERHRAALARVDATAVQRAAARWLPLEHLQVVGLGAGLRSADLEGALQRQARPSRAAAELPAGVRLAVRSEGAAPLFALRVMAPGGALREGANTAGIGAAWAQLLTSGAGDYDAEAFGEALDSLGATLDPHVHRSSVSISLTAPASEWRAAVDLLEACLLEPHFAPAEWSRVQAELLEDLRTRLDRPAEVAEDLTWAALFPSHPWGLPSAGHRTSVGRLSARRVSQWHQIHWVRDPQQPLVAAAVGGFDEDELRERLALLLSRLPEQTQAPLAPVEAAPPPAAHQRKAGQDQAICQVAFRGGALGTRQGAALTLAATLLGAQAGRLFLELRERRGLAYSVWAHQTSGVQGGLFQAGLATDPGRVGEAQAALATVLKELARSGPTPAEMEGARKILLAQAAVGQQRVAGRASELATGTAYGLPIGEEARRRWWAAISLEELQEAWSTALAGAHTVQVLPR